MEKFRVISGFLFVILAQCLLFVPNIYASIEPIESWSQDVTLTQQTANHKTVGYNNYLINLGGSTSDDFSLVAKLDTLLSTPSRSWVNSSVNLPQNMYWHTMVNKSDEIYLLGGTQYPPQISKDFTFVGAIDASGNINTWTPTTTLPQRLSKGAAAVSGNYIYFAGGWTDVESAATASKKVYFTQINSDGTLGNWNTTTDLPDVLWDHGMVSYAGYVYVVAGKNSLGETSQVFRAKVNVSGTLGSWTAMPSLPAVTRAGGYTLVDNYVFVVGGYNGSNWLKSVYYTTIDTNGQMSPWQTSANSLPVNHASGSLALVGGYLYLTGGWIVGSGYTDLVFKTKLNLVPSKPIVIFLPGMGGSWNYEAVVHGQDVPNSQWTIPGFIKNYDSLISALGNTDLHVYAYDWRKPVINNADALYNYAKTFGTKVNLVGHSMGGLIAQKMASLHPDLVDKTITLGTPNQGALSAYKIWEGADFSDFPLALNLISKLYLRINRNKYDSEVAIIQNTIPSVSNVLPTFDYLRGSLSKPVNPLLPLSDISNLSAIQGSGYDTPRYYTTQAASTFESLVNKWKNGKPVSTEYVDGDNTVVKTDGVSVAATHSEIPNSTQAQNKILEVLGVTGATSSLSLPTYERGVVVSVASPVNFDLVTSNGTVLPQDGIIILNNPDNGTYVVRVTPTGAGGSYTVYFGRIKNNYIAWDEVTGNIVSGTNSHVFKVDFFISGLGSNPIQSAQNQALAVINIIKGLSVSPVTKSLWLQDATRIYAGITDLSKSTSQLIYENRIITLFKQINILNGKIKNNNIIEKYRLVKADLEQDRSGR